MIPFLVSRARLVSLLLLLVGTGGGFLRLGAAPAFQPPVPVDLPAVILLDPKGWLWTSPEGFEIVSRSSEEATRTFVQNITLQRANLDALLPADFRVTWARPMRVVLYGMENPRPMPGMFIPIINKRLTEKAREEAAANREAKPLDVLADLRVLPGSWVADSDSVVIFNTLNPRVPGSDLSSVPASTFVSFLLESRMPPLPVWLREGFLEVYASASVLGGELDLAPFTWISVAQSRLMVRDRKIVPELVSLAELFARVNTADDPSDPARLQVLRAETALFVRWVFETKSTGGAPAFWKFARGATTGAGSQAWFRECFGLTQEAALEALKAYLPNALRKQARIRLERESRPAPLEIRPATAEELVLVLGEWERLCVRLVPAEYPELRTFYDEVTRRTLLLGTENNEAGPEVLAQRGLYAVDTGDDNAALPILEAAVASGKARPRAVVELARIRFDKAKAALGEGEKLQDSRLGEIRALLAPAFDARPRIARAPQLLADMWSVAATPPTPADLDLLLQAVNTMPRDVPLVISTARLLLDLGEAAKAHDVIETGLAVVTDAGGRRRLYALRSAARAALPK